MSLVTGDDTSLCMRTMVDRFDWSSGPLGPRADWPPELETAARMVLDSRFPMALVWGPGIVTIYNDAFRPILGRKPEALGRSFAEIWAEAWDEIGPIADRAFAGESTFIENFPLVIDRNGGPEQAWFTFCYSPVRLADGTVAGMIDTVVETTPTVETQETLKLANEELVHRLKNSLAIVQAIASQTLRHHAEEDAYASFAHRLEAMAHAHTVLVQQSWTTGSLQRAVRDSLDPHFDLDRVTITGTDLSIGSKSSMALSMMLHELATNAAKYGAISARGGRVAIEWHMEGPNLVFHWTESGGPPVIQPTRLGFGSRLIRKGFGSASDGALTFAPEGVRFAISVPVAELAR